MSLMEIMRQISVLRRSVQDQANLINDFMKSNADTMQLVRTELTGSKKGYDQQMLTALVQAENSLKNSLTSLNLAANALDRVENV